MRVCWVAILFPLAAFSQAPQAGALMGGVFLEHDADEFSIRAADSRVFRYRFDRNTHIGSGYETIDMARLAPGEQVEVIAVEQEGMPLRLALTVHVLPAARTPPPTITVQNRAPSAMDDRPLPFGAFSLTGVVFRIIPGAMALHTRNGEQDLILRANTRYMEDGNIVEPSALKLNMHVFVEAGKTLYGEIEAYRVVWGGILKP